MTRIQARSAFDMATPLSWMAARSVRRTCNAEGVVPCLSPDMPLGSPSQGAPCIRVRDRRMHRLICCNLAQVAATSSFAAHSALCSVCCAVAYRVVLCGSGGGSLARPAGAYQAVDDQLTDVKTRRKALLQELVDDAPTVKPATLPPTPRLAEEEAEDIRLILHMFASVRLAVSGGRKVGRYTTICKRFMALSSC